MAQIDMVPEKVQDHAKVLLEDVNYMADLVRQLEAAVQDLDQSWVSKEKDFYKVVVYKDIEQLKKVLLSIYSFGATAGDIANRRIERENNATFSMNAL